MRASIHVVLTVGLGLTLAACGGSSGKANGDGGGGGGGGSGDGGNANGDGGGGGGGGDCVQVMCMQGKKAGEILACGNCQDDDGDNKVDGLDPECTGACDDSEGTFSTGIPGDNVDPKWQDCFFDGDSGAGNDGCCYHSCCLIGAQSGDECSIDSNYDPTTDCPKTDNGSCDQALCQDYCQALTPPGCDCFGCCTVCNGADCKDVILAETCSADKIDDPDACPVCTKTDTCSGGGCNQDPGGDPCVLCPGQDPGDLPDSCGGQNTCPTGETTCTGSADCTSTEYCSNGCCVSNQVPD